MWFWIIYVTKEVEKQCPKNVTSWFRPDKFRGILALKLHLAKKSSSVLNLTTRWHFKNLMISVAVSCLLHYFPNQGHVLNCFVHFTLKFFDYVSCSCLFRILGNYLKGKILNLYIYQLIVLHINILCPTETVRFLKRTFMFSVYCMSYRGHTLHDYILIIY